MAGWLILGGMVFLGGCASQPSHLLGKEPGSAPQPVSVVRTAAFSSPITIRGVMKEKCPVAGCWFDLQDSRGTVRVDTKSAGFVVTEVPLGTTVTVGGTVSRDGEERLVDATGIRY